jgi:hypothetical protein
VEVAMQLVRKVLVVFLSAWFVLPVGVRAQQSAVVDQATLDQAVAAHVQRSAADRAAIQHVLERQAVREVAARAGIDIKRAEAAIATLDDAELHEVAEQARAVDDSQAGGQSKITLSTTTIIIGLLVLLLLIVALK